MLAVAFVVLATGFGVRDVRAGVIMSAPSPRRTMSPLGEGAFSAQTISDFPASTRVDRDSGCTGLLSFDGTSDNPERTKIVWQADVSCHLSGGMSPNCDSISVAGGGPNGAAIAETERVIDLDLLLVSVAAETRTRMPNGPCWRWFRPPRIGNN
jgi:hypothetical protein